MRKRAASAEMVGDEWTEGVLDGRDEVDGGVEDGESPVRVGCRH